MNRRSHHLHQIHHKKSLVMGANQQSLQHLSCAVPHLAEIILLGGKWGVYQVRREVVCME